MLYQNFAVYKLMEIVTDIKYSEILIYILKLQNKIHYKL